MKSKAAVRNGLRVRNAFRLSPQSSSADSALEINEIRKLEVFGKILDWRSECDRMSELRFRRPKGKAENEV